MKITLYIIIFSTLVQPLISQQEERWFIEKEDGKVGYIDQNGYEIFTGDFDILSQEYNSNLVFFQKGKKRGYLDLEGKVVFESEYVWGDYSEGLLPFRDDSGYYYLNTQGEPEFDLQNLELQHGKEISEIFKFRNGLAMIRIQDKGFQDGTIEGGCIVYAENVNLYPGNWFYGFIDKSGNWKITPQLESATSFIDSISIVESSNKTYFMNTEGKFVSQVNNTTSEYSEGFALVHIDEGVYYVNRFGDRLGDNIFQKANPFSNGMASVKLDGQWGFIDKYGRIKISPKYYVRSDFREGLAPVSIQMNSANENSYFIEAFIDKEGNEIIPYQKHVDYGNFKNGLAKARRFIYSEECKYTGYYELYYIDKDGNKIWNEIVKQ